MTLLEQLRYKIATVAFMVTSYTFSASAQNDGIDYTNVTSLSGAIDAFSTFLQKALSWPTYEDMSTILGFTSGIGRTLFFVSVLALTYGVIHKFVKRVNRTIANTGGKKPLDPANSRLDKALFYLVNISAFLYLVVALRFHIWVLGASVPVLFTFLLASLAFLFKKTIAGLIIVGDEASQGGSMFFGSSIGWARSGWTGTVGNMVGSKAKSWANSKGGRWNAVGSVWNSYQNIPRCDNNKHLNPQHRGASGTISNGCWVNGCNSDVTP
ncbi:MAG: hypothetical protein ABEJ03_00040 [Candidatus Nanohaloarchaea archaeon]